MGQKWVGGGEDWRGGSGAEEGAVSSVALLVYTVVAGLECQWSSVSLTLSVMLCCARPASAVILYNSHDRDDVMTVVD